MLDDRDRTILRHLRAAGPTGRSALAAATGLTPNAAGDRVRALLDAGLLRESAPAAPTGAAGRPAVPVSIAAGERGVVGLSLRPGGARAVRLDLTGAPLGPAADAPVPAGSRPAAVVGAAARLLRRALDGKPSDGGPLVVGVSATGFVDPVAGSLLGAAGDGRAAATSLRRLVRLAAGRPVVLQNDMQALAAAWRMTHGGTAGVGPIGGHNGRPTGGQDGAADEDVLLVRLGDGEVGGAALVAGRPNRGCVAGANEIGHARLGVETDRCYCGGVGCLERVCSTAHLRRLDGATGGAAGGAADGGRRGTLADRLSAWTAAGGSSEGDGDPALARLAGLVADGLAGAANFVRPHRLVIVGPLAADPAVAAVWRDLVARRVLGPIRRRMSVETPADATLEPAAAAGWLALAHLYTADWPAVDVAG